MIARGLLWASLVATALACAPEPPAPTPAAPPAAPGTDALSILAISLNEGLPADASIISALESIEPWHPSARRAQSLLAAIWLRRRAPDRFTAALAGAVQPEQVGPAALLDRAEAAIGGDRPAEAVRIVLWLARSAPEIQPHRRLRIHARALEAEFLRREAQLPGQPPMDVLDAAIDRWRAAGDPARVAALEALRPKVVMPW